jgi:2-polyprenyl-3-methyl-5-hydroxy-6-metoxy-1,4-benzoquinol methylase
MFEVIEHVKNPRVVLEMIDKVKTKGGTVLISTPDFEAPTYGKDDEQNKCHIRLYTTAAEDYEAVNKYGNTRKATSLSKAIGEERIVDMGVYSELINVQYE